jgi:NAD(P)H-hydrate epimerase
MPLPVISIAQMRDWEQATWAAGQTEAAVIRRVASCVAHRALQLTQPGDLILILAGKGHNGEDARGAREHLTERRVEVLDVTATADDLSKLDALLASRPALVIDGLFGIGLNRPLGPEWVSFIERVNAAGLPVLAVDVPSGLNADTGEPQGAAIEASVTLTVGAPKSECCGRRLGRLWGGSKSPWTWVWRPARIKASCNGLCREISSGIRPPARRPRTKGATAIWRLWRGVWVITARRCWRRAARNGRSPA